MDWNKSAEGSFADKIPAGMGLKLTVKKVKHASKKGEFTSSKGDPQIMVVFSDANDCEAIEMFTLTRGAAFRLAKLLGAIYPSGSMAKLKEYGIEPHHFQNAGFADQMLVGKSVVCDLSYDDRGYSEFVFVKWTPNLPASELGALAKTVSAPKAAEIPVGGGASLPETDVPFAP